MGRSYVTTALDTVPVTQYIPNIIFPLLGVRADTLRCISFDSVSAPVLSVMLSTAVQMVEQEHKLRELVRDLATNSGAVSVATYKM